MYLDFYKALDKVPYRCLIKNFMVIVFGVKSIVRQNNFCEKEQGVTVSGILFCWKDITSGIPLRSVLGSALFLDLPEDTEVSIKLFANDACCCLK